MGKIKNSDAFSEVKHQNYNPAAILGCVRVYIYIICCINKLINNSMFEKINTEALYTRKQTWHQPCIIVCKHEGIYK